MPRLTLTLLLALTTVVNAQTICFSTRDTTPTTTPPILRNEMWTLGSGGFQPLLSAESWDVIVGDPDGDGIMNDAPTDVDAFHVAGVGGLVQWFFSTTTTTSFGDGTTALDGDLFAIDSNGSPQISIAESQFMAYASTTSGIDLDAFCMGNGGEFYFSFGEDEQTTDPQLIAQNGGVDILDEQTVLRMDPGSSTAVVHFTKDQVVGFFNQALGLNASSVVDTTGITVDPLGTPGDLLLCCGSSSSALEGTVVTSRAGGMAWALGSSSTQAWFLSIGIPPGLNALSLMPGNQPVGLRSEQPRGSSSAGGLGSIAVVGAAPGEFIQLVVSNPILPSPIAWSSPQVSGFGALYPDMSDPFFYTSLQTPAWQLVADATGRATYRFLFDGLPAQTAAVIQAVLPTTGEVTNPVHVSILP